MSTLAEQVETARADSAGRGFAVTFTGAAASAYTRGCVDGYEGRPSRLHQFKTITERESYEYGYSNYHHARRDRHGCRYEAALF